MKAQFEAALIASAVTITHDVDPYFPSSAIHCDRFEQVAVGIEQEAEPRRKINDVENAVQGPSDIFNTVPQCEGELLRCCRSGFADMITADRNGVETWGVAGPELDRVRHQSHGWVRRENVFFLSD